MPLSLKSRLAKLEHKGQISQEEYQRLIAKLDGHDRQLKSDTIEEYTEWLKTQIVGIDNTTKEILVVRGNRWELASEMFMEEQLKEQENEQ